MPLQTHLCYDQDTNQPTHNWCSYQAVDDYSIIVEAIFLCGLVLFGIVSGVYFRRLIRYRRSTEYKHLFGQVFVRIFCIIFAWVGCSMIKVIINLGIYMAYMREDFKDEYQGSQNIFKLVQDSDPEINSPIVVLSTIFSLFDFLATFFVLLLIIIIPYQWLFTILLSTTQQKDIPLQSRIKISFYFKILKLIKIYFKYIRQLYVGLLLIEPFLMYFTPIGCQMPFINLIMIIIECGAIFMFYGYGYLISEHMRKNKLINMRKEDYIKIKIQYFLLVSVLIARILLVIYFRISIQGLTVSYQPNHNCSDPNHKHKVQTTIFLSLAHSIMHLLPLSVVLYIYRPNVEQRERDESLLRSQGYSDRDRSLRQDTSSDLITKSGQNRIEELSGKYTIDGSRKQNGISNSDISQCQKVN